MENLSIKHNTHIILRRAFYDEYLELLREYDIDFDEKYIFKPI